MLPMYKLYSLDLSPFDLNYINSAALLVHFLLELSYLQLEDNMSISILCTCFLNNVKIYNCVVVFLY